ncbi:DUF4244 domain-containing protein [Ruania alba]|uniref:DUF4244 domain-containing protein n=1 Tax=Ruania alba TaxID=648782 RepID=A0A1H5MQQ8_9MICO|nr:DUF4244 domain-containing protein [Ruania alba]SEE91077.1 Protein of unknown function [Ruania alba]
MTARTIRVRHGGPSRWHRQARAVVAARWSAVRAQGEAGMATAEYAIATLAAVAFAGMLLAIMRSDEVRGMLLSIIQQALSIGG